jgi:hypothetical protein
LDFKHTFSKEIGFSWKRVCPSLGARIWEDTTWSVFWSLEENACGLPLTDCEHSFSHTNHLGKWTHYCSVALSWSLIIQFRTHVHYVTSQEYLGLWSLSIVRSYK